MKIYNSTEYIEVNKVGNLKLEVINMWDFSTNPVCFKTIKTIGGGKTVISYTLKVCVEIKSPIHTRWEIVEKITDEIRKELEEKGYTVALFANLEEEIKKINI